MLPRLLPVLLCASLFAEAPRPRPGFEGVGLRLNYAGASGSGKAEDRSTGFELTGNFPLTEAGAWQYDWGFRYAQTRHDWTASPVDFGTVRGVSLNLSGYAATPAGRSRYAVLQVNADAATGAHLEDGITVQALYGADWHPARNFTVGYLFLAETRMARSDMILVVPTFRWSFAHDWSIGTGRKSLILERRVDDAWRAALTLAFLQEEARLADLLGQRQSYDSERLALLFGVRRSTAERVDELSLGWAFAAEASRRVGDVRTQYDLAPGLMVGLSSRWKF